MMLATSKGNTLPLPFRAPYLHLLAAIWAFALGPILTKVYHRLWPYLRTPAAQPTLSAPSALLTLGPAPVRLALPPAPPRACQPILVVSPLPPPRPPPQTSTVAFFSIFSILVLASVPIGIAAARKPVIGGYIPALPLPPYDGNGGNHMQGYRFRKRDDKEEDENSPPQDPIPPPDPPPPDPPGSSSSQSRFRRIPWWMFLLISVVLILTIGAIALVVVEVLFPHHLRAIRRRAAGPSVIPDDIHHPQDEEMEPDLRFTIDFPPTTAGSIDVPPSPPSTPTAPIPRPTVFSRLWDQSISITADFLAEHGHDLADLPNPWRPTVTFTSPHQIPAFSENSHLLLAAVAFLAGITFLLYTFWVYVFNASLAPGVGDVSDAETLIGTPVGDLKKKLFGFGDEGSALPQVGNEPGPTFGGLSGFLLPPSPSPLLPPSPPEGAPTNKSSPDNSWQEGEAFRVVDDESDFEEQVIWKAYLEKGDERIPTNASEADGKGLVEPLASLVETEPSEPESFRNIINREFPGYSEELPSFTLDRASLLSAAYHLCSPGSGGDDALLSSTSAILTGVQEWRQSTYRSTTRLEDAEGVNTVDLNHPPPFTHDRERLLRSAYRMSGTVDDGGNAQVLRADAEVQACPGVLEPTFSNNSIVSNPPSSTRDSEDPPSFTLDREKLMHTAYNMFGTDRVVEWMGTSAQGCMRSGYGSAGRFEGFGSGSPGDSLLSNPQDSPRDHDSDPPSFTSDRERLLRTARSMSSLGDDEDHPRLAGPDQDSHNDFVFDNDSCDLEDPPSFGSDLGRLLAAARHMYEPVIDESSLSVLPAVPDICFLPPTPPAAAATSNFNLAFDEVPPFVGQEDYSLWEPPIGPDADIPSVDTRIPVLVDEAKSPAPRPIPRANARISRTSSLDDKENAGAKMRTKKGENVKGFAIQPLRPRKGRDRP